MKTLKIILLSAIIMLLFILPSGAQSIALSKSVNKIFESYLGLKDALITGDGNIAENKARELITSFNEIPKKTMTKDQLTLWSKYEARLQLDSRHISEVNVISHQREHFASLSNNLYAVLKGLKLNQKPIYRQYCNMKKQYFLSDAQGGKDPYMGMDHCSKVTETLPANK